MSENTPELDVEAIRARLDALAPIPAPWEAWEHEGETNIGADAGQYVAHIGKSTWPNTPPAAELIAHAPTDLRRLLDENARLNTENARCLQIVNEITRDNAGLTACLDAVQQIHRVETYAFGTRTSFGDRVGCYICKTDGPCPTSIAASEMPRPPAEEAQERPETAGTGSGRGTGVAEASGTAQECEWPDVDGWTIHLRAGGGLIVTHDTGAYTPVLMSSDSLPVGAVLAFIADQQPEEDDETEPDLSLIPADLIKSDPGIRGGEPCITGTRIPAHEVAGYLADGATWEEVREMLPSLPSLPVPSTEASDER